MVMLKNGSTLDALDHPAGTQNIGPPAQEYHRSMYRDGCSQSLRAATAALNVYGLRAQLKARWPMFDVVAFIFGCAAYAYDALNALVFLRLLARPSTGPPPQDS